MTEDRYRSAGTLVFAAIGCLLCTLVAAGILFVPGDGWGKWAVLVFAGLWALDNAEAVRDELNRPVRPRGLPLDRGPDR
jgi:hypothetical protein